MMKRFHSVPTPALLCNKEPAQGTQSSISYLSLCLHDLGIGGFYWLVCFSLDFIIPSRVKLLIFSSFWKIDNDIKAIKKYYVKINLYNYKYIFILFSELLSLLISRYKWYHIIYYFIYMNYDFLKYHFLSHNHKKSLFTLLEHSHHGSCHGM